MAAEKNAVTVTVDPTDIWGRIPPEEKFELVAKVQSRGVWAGIILIMIGSTLAVGFKFDWLMWGAILLSPLVFQFVVGKAWRDLRPPLMLEYLAARSAARRYAFATKSQDLGLALIFRGALEQLFEKEELEEQLDRAFAHRSKIEVWVALFNDCIVMISERAGGAECAFAHLLNDKLTITGESPESGEEYANDRQLILTFISKQDKPFRFRLTSRHSAALVVFEHKALQLQKNLKATSPAAASPEAVLDAMNEWGT